MLKNVHERNEVMLNESSLLPEQEQRVFQAFAQASVEDWEDWRWQMRYRFKTQADLSRILPLTADEKAGIESCGQKLTMAIPPYFASLIDPEDPSCPIRRQCVPTRQELVPAATDMVDPCGEEKDSPVRRLVHRYPDRVLFLVSESCAMYCRHCTRSRIVGEKRRSVNSAMYEDALAYIRAHTEIRDVLISGGDPLLLSDSLLEYLIRNIKAIPHVEFVRIGTRVPVSLPQRITPALLKLLKSYAPLWISIHFNHPKEITDRARQACHALADNGIPLGSQTVLLRGINDSPEVMKKLMHELLKIRVRPYYIYQCDPVVGTSHFRTPVKTGLTIMEHLRGHTTGYAVPTFVIDVPGGGGKVPVSPDYVLKHEDGNYFLRNYAGEQFLYRDQI